MGKNTIIKFTDKELADKLKEISGESYMIESGGCGVEMYSFIYTEQLAQFLVTNFDNHDYYFSNKLLF
jgi:hypothetical protein